MKKSNSKGNKTLKSVLIFAIIMVVSIGVGALFGSLMKKAEESGVDFRGVFNNIDNYAVYALPLLFAIILIVAGGISLMYYLKSKKSFKLWDGEDEDSINKVECMISKSVIISNVALIIDYFLIGVWIHFSESENVTLSDKIVGINSIIVVACFFISLVFFIVIQRCGVELEKKINPEKRGEVLDMNFQKEWESSFDEAEKSIACKAGYKSFKVTNGTCLALWLLSIIGQLVFKIGIVPISFVTIIWLVSTLTYQIEAMKLENKK